MNSLLKFFYHPMVAMSLVLHGLFLAVPIQPQPELPPEEPPEAEAVKLSRISSLKVPPKSAPTSKATPPPKLPKPAIKAAASRPRPPIPNLAPPKPLPTVSPTPVATPTPAAPIATPAPQATPIATSPSPEPTTPLALGQLQSNADLGVGQASAAQFYSFFPEPEAFFTTESLQQADINLTDPLPIEGITNMTRLENMGLNQVRSEILPQMYADASFSNIGGYGGGDLYEVRQANSVGYVVLLKEDSLGLATFVIEWNRNPNQPSAVSSKI